MRELLVMAEREARFVRGDDGRYGTVATRKVEDVADTARAVVATWLRDQARQHQLAQTVALVPADILERLADEAEREPRIP